MKKQFYVIDWKTGKANYEFYFVSEYFSELETCNSMNDYSKSLIDCIGEFERFYYIS
jgi:hypothetical protein